MKDSMHVCAHVHVGRLDIPGLETKSWLGSAGRGYTMCIHAPGSSSFLF